MLWVGVPIAVPVILASLGASISAPFTPVTNL